MKFILAAILTLASAQALAIDVTADGLTANPWCEKFDDGAVTYFEHTTFATDGSFKQLISEIAADGSVGEIVSEFDASWALNNNIITLSIPNSTETQNVLAEIIDNSGLHLLIKDTENGEQLADLTVCQ